MDPCRFLAETHGFFTRSEALDTGLRDSDLTSGVRRGALVRFRHGSYTFRDLWDDLDEPGRHLVRVRSAVRGIRGEVAVSHVSAALVHGMSTWGIGLDRVHVTRLDDGVGRIDGDVVHHQGKTLAGEPIEVDGLLVMPPVRSAIETGTMGTPESALVVLDNLLHLRLANEEDLESQFALMQRWPRTRRLHVPVLMAQQGAASPGESRGRWLFRCAGIPAPALQHAVHGPTGELIGICDWAWLDHGVLGEFDGRIKYGRLLEEGQQPGDVVFAEKLREDRIREVTDCRMVRLICDDLARPRQAAQRVREKLRLVL